MTKHGRFDGRGPWSRTVPLLALVAGLALGGCSDILEVDNPNNLLEDDLGSPASARALAAGAGATVTRSIGAILGPYSTVTDEVSWRGSRDAWFQLDIGNLADPGNEFTDDAFRFVGEGRWMADEAVRRLEAFDAAGELKDTRGVPDRTPLVRAYFYAAISYITIADMFDDFALSDRRNPTPPEGEANMAQFYDQAITYLTKGLVIARAITNAGLENDLQAVRARAEYSKELWDIVNPTGQVVANGLVNDVQANADATAILARSSAGPRFRVLLPLDSDDIAYAGEASLAYNINQRGELRIAPQYHSFKGTTAPDDTVFTGLMDPITNARDPVIRTAVADLTAAYVYQNIVAASGREMLLILAEAALAQNDLVTFGTHINAVRALDALPAWTGQIPALEILKHERRVNLFLQGRRLADLYRWGENSAQWQTAPPSTAASTRGTFFPVTCIEIRAHPEDFEGTAC
jgi:starch-binding outer membrane protein, SusD/RagB family